MYSFLKMQTRKMAFVMQKLSIQKKNQPPLQLRNTMVCNGFRTFAIAQYIFFSIGQHIPQWNTRVQVCISEPGKKNLKDSGKADHGKQTYVEENFGQQHDAKVMGTSERPSNRDQQIPNLMDETQTLPDPGEATTKKNRRFVDEVNIAN